MTFDAAKTVSDAFDCAGDAGATVQSLESDFESIEPTMSAEYVPDPEMSESEVVADYQPMIQSMFEQLADLGDYSYVYPGSAPVKRMTVSYSPSAPVAPASKLPVANCTNPWWPTEGRVEVGFADQTLYPHQRFVYQSFTWDAANLLYLKACRPNITVEPDAVFDRSDGLTYLGTKLTKLSNLPRRYDDTRRFDSDDETSYTVGTGDAQQLVADRKYFTLIRTKTGNASADRMFVRFQNGARLPEYCYATWCIFPALTGSDEVVVDKWMGVPGGTTWTH